MTADRSADQDVGKRLLRTAGSAALATLDAGGAPFGSHVIVAPADDASPLMVLSRLAVHTRNLERDPRASLLLVGEPQDGSDLMTAPRLSLTGRVLRDGSPRSKALFLARHPDAARYADFGDFAVYRLQVESGHLVAGFGRIARFSAAELLL